MIKSENRDFLLNTFNIDVTRYSEEELNLIINNILDYLEKEIEKKQQNIKKLELEIMEE